MFSAVERFVSTKCWQAADQHKRTQPQVVRCRCEQLSTVERSSVPFAALFLLPICSPTVRDELRENVHGGQLRSSDEVRASCQPRREASRGLLWPACGRARGMCSRSTRWRCRATATGTRFRGKKFDHGDALVLAN